MCRILFYKICYCLPSFHWLFWWLVTAAGWIVQSTTIFVNLHLFQSSELYIRPPQNILIPAGYSTHQWSSTSQTGQFRNDRAWISHIVRYVVRPTLLSSLRAFSTLADLGLLKYTFDQYQNISYSIGYSSAWIPLNWPDLLLPQASNSPAMN